MRKCAAFVLVLSLTGCVHTTTGTEFYRAENFQLTETRGKNVGLILINGGSKTAFLKSFEKVYGNDHEFMERLRQLLVGALEAQSVRVGELSVPQAVLKDIAETHFDLGDIGASRSERLRRELGGLASRYGLDMIFLVRRWSVSSDSRTGPPADGFQRPTLHGDLPNLLPLPEHSNDLQVELHISQLQANDLSPPQPSPETERQDHCVSGTSGRRVSGAGIE